MRPSDCWLWESEPTFSVMPEILSGSLEVRFRLHAYCAFLPHRYPSSIAVLGGTGMKVEANE
jgi:hypothetical protein